MREHHKIDLRFSPDSKRIEADTKSLIYRHNISIRFPISRSLFFQIELKFVNSSYFKVLSQYLKPKFDYSRERNFREVTLVNSVHTLVVIPQRETKSMRGKHIFSLLDCGQYNGTVHCSRMAIDCLVNDWL